MTDSLFAVDRLSTDGPMPFSVFVTCGMCNTCLGHQQRLLDQPLRVLELDAVEHPSDERWTAQGVIGQLPARLLVSTQEDGRVRLSCARNTDWWMWLDTNSGRILDATPPQFSVTICHRAKIHMQESENDYYTRVRSTVEDMQRKQV